jgi:hypothetical protein
MRRLLAAAGLCALASAAGLKESKYYDRPALLLSNNVLELTVLPLGGSIASIVLSQDAEKTDDDEVHSGSSLVRLFTRTIRC